jgi:putative transcriptional regulator
MPIIVNVDLMLARRKMRLNTLAEKVGITPQNLSVLKTGRAKAIRFSTLELLCQALECQPGDLLSFEPGQQPGPETSPEPLDEPKEI